MDRIKYSRFLKITLTTSEKYLFEAVHLDSLESKPFGKHFLKTGFHFVLLYYHELELSLKVILRKSDMKIVST